jgi:hypothetical protein
MTVTVTTADVGKFTRKLYKFLDQGHKFTFRRMPRRRGYVLTNTFPTEVHLDHRDSVISTLVHEALHYFYPTASETWVLRMESKIINKLTDRQVRNILRRWAINI